MIFDKILAEKHKTMRPKFDKMIDLALKPPVCFKLAKVSGGGQSATESLGQGFRNFHKSL
jgi:hypothetical protein